MICSVQKVSLDVGCIIIIFISLIVNLDPCTKPKIVGSCNEQRLRFYYDSSLQQCEPFIYSGCDGNENNFPSLNECSQTCGKVTQIK